MIKRIIDTILNSASRIIGRIVGYAIIGLLAFFVYNTFFKAMTIDTENVPLKNDYLDYFGRILDSKNYFNTNYLAFTHKCENSTCYTLLTGDIQKGIKNDTQEIIYVDSLPTASEETLNKVYEYNNKYYITEKQSSGNTPLPLGEDLNGKTIYLDIDRFISFYESNKESGINSSSYVRCGRSLEFPSSYYFDFNDNYFSVNTFCNVEFSDNKPYTDRFFYFTQPPYNNYLSSYTYTQKCIISEWVTDVVDFSSYFSLTPFETTYNWTETQISMSDNGYTCKNCNYITFKEGESNVYESGTYENLEITGNVFYTNLDGADLERGNGYEKVITLSLLFGIGFFIVYKLLRKQ